MSKQKAKILGHIIYWFVVCAWALLIPLFLYNQVEETKRVAIINGIKDSPTTDWFEYHKIETTKESFALWEDIYFKSTRTIQVDTPYITHDEMRFTFSEFLMCNYDDWEWFSRVDPESVTKSVEVKEWTYTSPPRKRTWWRPYYIPAQCYLQSRICIEVQSVEKCQYMESNVFTVN